MNAAHQAVADLQVVEGISGYWFYHLSNTTPAHALCGAHTMYTAVPLSAWGCIGHLHERYCAECARLAGLDTAAVAKPTSRGG